MDHFFKKTLLKYKKNKIDLTLGKPNNYPQKKTYKYFIIIPSFSEKLYIKKTLESISQQEKNLLDHTLIIIVINNSINDNNQIKENNYQTYKSVSKREYSFEVIIIDCFSKEHAFSDKKSGVGMARKIGHDYCINYSHANSLFFSLDADTIIHHNYLKKIIKQFNTKKFSSAVINFKHQTNNNPLIQKSINKYEKLLKKIAYNIRLTGSPYGFVSMGSTIVCTMKAYISVGGMPAKRATEDFYFLQKLAKYDQVHCIKSILVYPSSRAEQRVHLGTGYRMSNLKNKNLFTDLSINSNAYSDLKNFFNIIEKKWNCDIKEIISSSDKKNSKLHAYLKSIKFSMAFKRIQKNSSNQKQLVNQFHIWFDNFKIYKFLKLHVN